MRIWPRKKAPSSLLKDSVTTSPQMRPVARISSRLVWILPRTWPATISASALSSSQVTLPLSPTTTRPSMANSPSKVPSMRIPPRPRKSPRQLIPGPITDETRSITGSTLKLGSVLRLLKIIGLDYTVPSAACRACGLKRQRHGMLSQGSGVLPRPTRGPGIRSLLLK